MQIYNIEVKNSLPVLTDLIETIRNFNDSELIYLSGKKSDELEKPGTQANFNNSIGINEAPLPVFLKRLGIRSLTLNSSYEGKTISTSYDAKVFDGESNIDQWQGIKSNDLIEDLKALFQNCRTIAFYDWATVTDASDLWYGLLSDVFRPLKKTDLEFIFYLGDPTKKLSFLVDEVLDIISAFSKHGKTTFCLDENEAVKLWMVLNGETPDSTFKNYSSSELKRKYFSIFRTMNVDRLLIYSVNDAILYSNDQQFVLARKIVDQSIEIAKDARDNFVAGFTIGLLLQLEIQHCIALGLIVFGAHGEYKTSPDQTALLSYIERWIKDLDDPNAIYLYQ